MPRSATGSVSWNARRGRWEVRCTLANGRRSSPIGMPGLAPCERAPGGLICRACAACLAALAKGEEASARIREGGFVPAGTGETVSEWYGRYYKAAARGEVGRKNRGRPQTAVGDREASFKKWIEPELGALAMLEVSADDIRRMVRKLDDQIRVRTSFYAGKGDRDERGKKPGLAPKAAANIYGEVTSGFREAVNSKVDALRVLKVDPTAGVLPPNGGPDREQAALYPDELVTLLGCPLVPVVRRVTYALAVYTGCRLSELGRVRPEDVDLEHELVTVRGSKTDAARRQVPIEPALRPLLEALLARAKKRKAGAPLVDVPRADGKGGAADLVKGDLRRAELSRADLWRDDEHAMPFTFHGLRHTAITHWAIAGRPQMWLQAVAGHTDAEMTRRYLDAASVVRRAFGDPHPELPANLLPSADPFWMGIVTGIATEPNRQNAKGEIPKDSAQFSRRILRPQRESNPRYRRERPMS